MWLPYCPQANSGSNSVSLQKFHYLSEFSHTSLENINLTCSVIPRCIPQECHPLICLVLIYHSDKSQNSFPRIKFSKTLSSVESKKGSGKCSNAEGKVLTTVVFPEAGGPRTQILGAMEQGYENVKMQNSKNPNQLPTLVLHNTNVATMKQWFQLESCLSGDFGIGLHWEKKGQQKISASWVLL